MHSLIVLIDGGSGIVFATHSLELGGVLRTEFGVSGHPLECEDEGSPGSGELRKAEQRADIDTSEQRTGAI
jgi:hypothetical protein